MTPAVRNILTFDVEDWPQSTLDPALPITRRVIDNTARILGLLAAADTRATFFVLGLVAGKFPELVRRIRDAGHEVACHGHDHRPVHSMEPAGFRDDLRRSIRAIEDASGTAVRGYRAPDFSIPASHLWALSILAEEGLEYDSSLFPFAGPRYGVADAFRAPCLVRSATRDDFVEFPLATIEVFGLRLPVAGGGYFRLFPYGLTRTAIRRLNRGGVPATTYFHPYEIDPEELRTCGRPVPLALHLSQSVGRSRVAARLGRLLRDFSWGPAADRLAERFALAGGRILDLTPMPAGPARWIPGGPPK